MSDATEVADGTHGSRAPRGQGVSADAVWILGTYVLLGLVGGVLWWLLVEPAYFTKGENGGLGMGEVQLGKRFNADGWYAVIAIVFGLLSGAALAWVRTRDHLVTAGLILFGSVVAAVVMSAVGTVLGPEAPETVAASAPVGARIAMQVAVTAPVNYLVWPIAVLVGTLLVLWSPPVDSGR